MRLSPDGKLTVGTYEGAFPHIGEAMFKQEAEHQYGSFDEAFQAACKLGGTEFLADIFSNDQIPQEAIEDNMIFRAVLYNAQHPEYGVATIPFPIKNEDYDDTIELLKPLEIGDAISRDCRIEEILGDYPALKQMEMTGANLDELDYLAKRLDSFDGYEMTQFQGAASSLGLHGVDEMINLTFCCQESTVITDFHNLESAGRKHFLTVNKELPLMGWSSRRSRNRS
jgi:hypothetical protein